MCLWIGILNIVEMYIQAKATYRFNAYQNPNDAFFQK